jgi:hypothetical protein
MSFTSYIASCVLSFSSCIVIANGSSWKMWIMYRNMFCLVLRLLVFVRERIICVGWSGTWNSCRWDVSVARGSGAADIVWNSDR